MTRCGSRWRRGSALLDDARALQKRRDAGERLPLYGLPFAVKDNIDVAGLPTTAACPAFAYRPEAHARVVARLIAAGALPIGKTNLDQFATGLVGVRSPYGIPHNPFDDRYIVGGSSSGSAVSVAVGEVSFALGTDTAGSGRVPAAFNNIVGLKPSRGLLSTAGVVPACRSLDCVSVFALTVEDAAAVADVARGYDADDPASRPEADAVRFQPGPRPPRFRFGVPAGAALEFFGDARAAECFSGRSPIWRRWAASASSSISRRSARRPACSTTVRSSPSAWRRPGATAGHESRRRSSDPVRTILEGGAALRRAHGVRGAAPAGDAAPARGRVARPRRLPGGPDDADHLRDRRGRRRRPCALNALLGTYVNFVNLLDLAAMAVPVGFRADGLPAGATLIAPWGRDAVAGVVRVGDSPVDVAHDGRDPAAAPAAPGRSRAAPPSGEERIPIAVVGAHLSGEPLNHQLIDGGGRFVRAARTAPAYRLYALPNTTPAKPGMMRVAERGASIELEVWSLSPDAFGRFVARVPPPLCIGKIALDDGTQASGFLCEPNALMGATDISHFGGWRPFLRSLN